MFDSVDGVSIVEQWCRSFAGLLCVLLSVLIATASCVGCDEDAAKPASPPTPIQVGWQPPWANQGQLVAILKNTDLLAKQHVSVDFVPFTYGGPMIEAALAGRIDVVMAGDQPVLNLLSKSNDWRVVARLPRYRSAIVVPAESPLKSLADLDGKRIATAFGSTTHRDLVRILNENGLEGKVQIVSLDQAEHAGVINAGGKKQWSDLDGIATYDPTIAAALKNGSARILQDWGSPGLMAVRRSVIDNRKEDVRSFLRAYRDAFVHYASDPSTANAWYSAESRLPLSDADYASIAAFEPSLRAKIAADVNISMTQEVVDQTSRNSELAIKLGIQKAPVNFSQMVANDLLP